MDISGLWTGQTKDSPRNEFIHYTSRGEIEGIRQGDWKLLMKKPRNRNNANAGQVKPTQIYLFNLAKDLGEQSNLADQHPEIVERLRIRMLEVDAEIAENARTPWFSN